MSMWLSDELKQQNDQSLAVGNQMDTKQQIAEGVRFVRLELYNRDLPCGPKAIRNRLEQYYHVKPLPSERTIARILAASGLTHGRTGIYE